MIMNDEMVYVCNSRNSGYLGVYNGFICDRYINFVRI